MREIDVDRRKRERQEKENDVKRKGEQEETRRRCWEGQGGGNFGQVGRKRDVGARGEWH